MCNLSLRWKWNCQWHLKHFQWQQVCLVDLIRDYNQFSVFLLTDTETKWQSNITATTNEMLSWHDPVLSIALRNPQCSSWELMHRLQLSASTKANRRDYPWGFVLRTFRALVLTKWNPVMLYTASDSAVKFHDPLRFPEGEVGHQKTTDSFPCMK